MHVTPYDNRDQASERPTEAFRVEFWAPHEGGGWASDGYEVTGTDVLGAIAWAEASRAGREYCLFSVIGRHPVEVVHLAGVDPTSVAGH